MMIDKMKNTAVLLLSTPMPLARKGVVAAISEFLIAHNGSVLHSDDHLDTGRDLFLSRLEWDLDGFDIPISDFEHHFRSVAERFRIHYHLALTDYRPKIAILVSGYDHCLADLLYRHRTGDLACDIAAIISTNGIPSSIASSPKSHATGPANRWTPTRRSSTMPAPPKPKPDFRSLLISTADSILAVSNPHPTKLLHFDCSAMKLCPTGTTLSSHNCELVLA
jgi:hypothetical protein